MFLGISRKLQLLLGKVLESDNLHLSIFSNTNWAVVNYWGDGAFAFDPQEESDFLLEEIAKIIHKDHV